MELQLLRQRILFFMITLARIESDCIFTFGLMNRISWIRQSSFLYTFLERDILRGQFLNSILFVAFLNKRLKTDLKIPNSKLLKKNLMRRRIKNLCFVY